MPGEQSQNEVEDEHSSTASPTEISETQRHSMVEDSAQQALDFTPPFLVRTKSRQEKLAMYEQYKRQDDTQNPYALFHKVYSRFSTSALLENKASVARDHLANERTFLAWLRTSLSLITVGVAITQLYHLSPNSEYRQQQGRALGATFVAFSIVFLAFANARYFHAQVAMTKGHFPASRGSVVFGSACVLGVLIAMFVVIVTEQS